MPRNHVPSQPPQAALALATALALAACGAAEEPPAPAPPPPPPGPTVKLYWLIPDGVRAEPAVFDLYGWAAAGELPNFKRLMAMGVHGYSVPVFPSNTPVNFATLLTGSYPEVHGVADGPMHVEGFPLDRVSLGGFRSVARRVPAVWSHLEDAGYRVLLESMPGSTPPETEQGVILRGRWGVWGTDTHAVNFVPPGAREGSERSARLFFAGPALTEVVEPTAAEGWPPLPGATGAPAELTLQAWGTSTFARLYDLTGDGVHDRVQFSPDKQEIIADLGVGDWSAWFPVGVAAHGDTVDSHVSFHVIELGETDFRLRLLFDNLNRTVTVPPEAAAEVERDLGPMIDFVDNYPPQLVERPADKATFLAELHRSFDWHAASIPVLDERYHPDAVIHDIYSPNQMLTSRWWLGYLDPASELYGTIDEHERDALWAEVKGMYRRLDEMVGLILDQAGDDTVIVFSADHGACALDHWVHLNDLLARHGYLALRADPQTGAASIDWAASRAVFLGMYGVWIDPEGLDGPRRRPSGPAYEALRAEVRDLLLGLEDPAGVHPVTSVTFWEDAPAALHLPADRVGDLVVSNRHGYAWNEETTEDLGIFSTPPYRGYKQGILPEETSALWTPFLMAGPGVRAGVTLEQPIRHIDQLPTILTALGVPVPEAVQGEVLPGVLR
ncbi:MAG: alkaline phosphatase family protein [Pseudomonadota bacterium]